LISRALCLSGRLRDTRAERECWPGAWRCLWRWSVPGLAPEKVADVGQVCRIS
jgi:hypothetical protein